MPLVGSPRQGEGLGQADARAPRRRTPSSSDSAITRTSTTRSPKPTVLSTASSPVRSRTEMAMVLPVTSSSVKNTTMPMARIRNSMFPICFTNEAMKAASVWVRVSQAEFANPSSMALRHLDAVRARARCGRCTSRRSSAPTAAPSPSGSPSGTRTA